MNPIYLTEKHLESLMVGDIVAIEGPLNFSTKIVPPDTVRDTCHVSYSLHRAIVRRLEEKCATMQTSAHEGWQRADAADERIEELAKEREEARRVVDYEQQRRRDDERVWLETRDANKRATERINELEAELTRLRLNIGHNA